MKITIHKDVEELLKELNEIGESVIFGGYLRDRLLDKIPSDVDIATKIPIEIIEEKYAHMEKASRRVTISGHDVFSFKLHRTEKIFVEIVSIKNEIKDKSFEADYTINSLLHNGYALIDRTNGINDYENKLIKEVDINIIHHDLKERPYLWLKTIRLVSMTGFNLSEKVFQALNENKETIQNVMESIMQTEGHKTMNGKNPLKAMQLLSKMGLISTFDYSNNVEEKEILMQPQQKLCYLALLTNKQTIDDYIRFYCMPTDVKEKYEELYRLYNSGERYPNRLKNQLINIQKLLKNK